MKYAELDCTQGVGYIDNQQSLSSHLLNEVHSFINLPPLVNDPCIRRMLRNNYSEVIDSLLVHLLLKIKLTSDCSHSSIIT
jgi:hypothetical protein